MKFILTALLSCIFAISLSGQKPDEILATATGLTFTSSALSDDGRKLFVEQNTLIAYERSRLLSQMLTELLLETEAKSRGITSDSLTAGELKKIANPTEAEIKAIFDANRTNFGERTLEQVRKQILAFLRQNSEQKAIGELVENLKIKFKFAAGKDINAPNLKPIESLFSIAGKSVAAREFEARFKASINDAKAEITSEILADLESAIFSTLVNQEAKARNVDAGEIIAVEISNKMREFSEDERSGLETALRKQLFAKYKVNLLVSEPRPVAHNVSVDDDPASGKPTAAVTVVMFSDFQCSACAGTHPVLKKVLAEYADKVRLIVRDFPLDSIHENAFRAALAANAARGQDKYFEYIDVLYRNQENLDDASLRKYAAELGLNLKQFELDFSSEKAAAEVRKDVVDGKNYGIGGTPAIFVNGVRIQRLTAEGFRVAMERALAISAPK